MPDEEIHTNERLATRMEALDKYFPERPEREHLEELIRLARTGYYHDYLSPLPMPDVQLVCDLRALAVRPHAAVAKPHILQLVAEVCDGNFNATIKESEEWARSPQGQAVLDSLPSTMREMLKAQAPEQEKSGNQEE